jgi:hypothetical protein
MKIRKLTYNKGEWVLRLDKQMYNWLGPFGKFNYVVIEFDKDHTLKIRRLQGEDLEAGGEKRWKT